MPRVYRTTDDGRTVRGRTTSGATLSAPDAQSGCSGDCGCGGGNTTNPDACCVPGADGYLVVEKVSTPSGDRYRLIGQYTLSGQRSYTRSADASTNFLFIGSTDSAVQWSVDLAGQLGFADLLNNGAPIAEGPNAGRYCARSWTRDTAAGVNAPAGSIVATSVNSTSVNIGGQASVRWQGATWSHSVSGALGRARVEVRRGGESAEVSAVLRMPGQSPSSSPYLAGGLNVSVRLLYQQGGALYARTSITGVGALGDVNITTLGAPNDPAAPYWSAWSLGRDQGGFEQPQCFTGAGSIAAFTGDLQAEFTAPGFLWRHTGSMTYAGSPVVCEAGPYAATCDGEEPPSSTPAPSCCNPPSASGFAFTPETYHVLTLEVDIRRYLATNPPQLVRAWSAQAALLLDAPALFSACQASQSGAVYPSALLPFGVIQSTVTDFQNLSGGFPTTQNAALVLNGFLGESASNPGGSRVAATMYDGPQTSGSPVFALQLFGGGAVTRTGTVGGLAALQTTVGWETGLPSTGTPFYTQIGGTLQSVGGLVAQGSFRYAVTVGLGVRAVNFARCADLLAALRAPMDPAVRRALLRQLGGCAGCGDQGVEP